MDAPVAFVTLFLGLVSGPQSVEMTTTREVAALDLLLDEQPQVRIAEPPWSARLDFGSDLMPHLLVAVARDVEGRELGRVRQWVNLARPPAEVQLLVERDATGRPRAARWVGGSVASAGRPEIEMTLDGRALRLDAQGRATLPTLDLAAPHVLSALVNFGPSVSARHDLVLGGSVNDEARVELTAIPVDLSMTRPAQRKQREPGPSDFEIRVDGAPILATAIERGPAQVLVVRPSELEPAALSRLGGVGKRPSKSALTFSGGSFDTGDRSARRFEARLERDDRIRMIWPHPATAPGASLPTRLFQGSREFRGDAGGFFWLLTAVEGPPEDAASKPRFADAVAVAGLQAFASGRRRAVVLLLDDSALDPSFYDPANVRRFLQTLQVPLFVWSIGARTELGSAWGGATPITSPRALERAVGELRETLDRQRILWVPGNLMPHRAKTQRRLMPSATVK